jgi:hypothetical protein
VREGATVAVVGEVGPQPLWAFYGAAQLGAVTRFVGPEVDPDAAPGEDARVVVLPVAAEGSVDPGPGTKLAAYGGAPDAATTLHWETELWSENPAVHPTAVDPDDALLVAGETYSHAAVLEAARAVCDEDGVDADTAVVVRASLADPRVVAAGLVAPILAGGSVVVPESADDAAGDVAVVGDGGDAPEPRVRRASDVPL